MSMKDQALKVLRGQTPDIIPSYFTTCQVMVCSAYPDMPPFTAGEQGKENGAPPITSMNSSARGRRSSRNRWA